MRHEKEAGFQPNTVDARRGGERLGRRRRHRPDRGTDQRHQPLAHGYRVERFLQWLVDLRNDVDDERVRRLDRFEHDARHVRIVEFLELLQRARIGEPELLDARREPRLMTTAAATMSAWSCTVRIAVDDERVLRDARRDLAALLQRVDAVASRFRPDSALSKANARAGRPTPIPRMLSDLVAAALEAAQRSDGAVDPTVGQAMDAIGYDRDIALVEPDGLALVPRLRSRTWRDVRLDREVGLLTVPLGTSLDLGATAKAYVADLAARTTAARYGVATMVELGGDVAVAGARDGGWQIRVAERDGAAGQVVTLRRGGLTTSTTQVRQWRRGGRVAHHIVDPATGLPADGHWRTASVYAPSAVAANTASTAAIVLGDDACAWLEREGLAARLVSRDGSVHTVGAWPAPVPAGAVAS